MALLVCFRIYEAVHERQGKNAKELTVEKGDVLQVHSWVTIYIIFDHMKAIPIYLIILLWIEAILTHLRDNCEFWRMLLLYANSLDQEKFPQNLG